MATFLFFWMLHCVLGQAPLPLWRKHYVTYSVENDVERAPLIREAIREWNVRSLELVHVARGQGDIRFYFKDLVPPVIGVSEPPEKGIVTIARNASHVNVTKVIQHEVAHALGLPHSKNVRSLMYWAYAPDQHILKRDRRTLRRLYRCRYDSVTLLNGCTYLKFKGSFYERLDLHTGRTTRAKLWHPSLHRVTSMYRNGSDYVVVSGSTYYTLNSRWELENEGLVSELFPNLSHKLVAVLTLGDGSRVVFSENNSMVYPPRERYPTRFEVFPEGPLQGAFVDANHIYLVSKEDIYRYDEKFQFLNKSRLCDDLNLKKLHCCNKYSNL